MTKNRRRHAAPSRVSKVAGRAALGVLGAPVAMFAVASPAVAATADADGRVSDDDAALDTRGEGAPALPGIDNLPDASAVAGLPVIGDLVTALPASDVTDVAGLPV